MNQEREPDEEIKALVLVQRYGREWRVRVIIEDTAARGTYVELDGDLVQGPSLVSDRTFWRAILHTAARVVQAWRF